MKNKFVFLVILISIFLISCDEKEIEAKTGTVVFGANYHVINCISNVDIFINGEHIGQLETPTDSVPNCDINYGLKKELEVGKYNYKVVIRPLQGTGCTKDIAGALDITEGGCETVFINYYEVFAN